MKKTVTRILSILILLFGVFYISKSVLIATVGKWLSAYVDTDAKLSINEMLSYVSSAISGIATILLAVYFQDIDKRKVAPYFQISSDSDYPAPVSDVKSQQSRNRTNTLDIDLTRPKRKFRYVYAKVKNTGNCVIERCSIARQDFSHALELQKQYKVRFLVPEPLLFPSKRHIRHYKASYRLEDGTINITKGEYSLIVNTISRTVTFKDNRTK